MSAPPSGTTGDTTPPEEINPRDKPFILVMTGTIALVAVGAYAVVTGRWADAKDYVAALIPLVSMGWGFYLKPSNATP